MESRKSAWVLNLGNLKGIPLRVHITFFLLLLWVALDAAQIGENIWLEVIFVLSIFLCVVLHELGHAIAARRFGISTRDIVIYPFGGIATLSAQGSPRAELVIALAGPLVNVVIALAVLPWVQLRAEQLLVIPQDFIYRFFLTNVALVLFNLIPAIPMDGGRVLRSILALLQIKRATLIACRLSQAISILFGVTALYFGNPVLLLVSVVVFTNSLNELFHERASRDFGSLRASDLMTEASQLQLLRHGATVSEAIKVALRSLQSVFPVMHNEELIGVVDKNALINAAVDTHAEPQYVSALMERDYPTAAPDERLEAVLQKFQGATRSPLMIVLRGKLLGIIFKEKLMEFLLVRGLMHEAHNP